MSFRQRLASAAPGKETVVTIGVFDGVHQGHRHLLRQVVQLAGDRYVPTVITFSNRPVTVLRPGTEPSYLTTLDQRVDLIKQQGIELVVCLEFTLELAQVTAADFAKLLAESLNMKGLVLGPDSAVGKDRQGDLAFMQQQGEQLGFWARSVEPFEIEGQPVKSRRIRDAVSNGNMAVCPELLGRNHLLSGVVVLGDQRGRTLGFPTANLEVDPQLLLPGDGIYATWAIIDGERHQSATSIGVRPTFGLSNRLVEVFVMDFSDDIYGKTIGVEFIKKVRDQEKFDGLDELVKQINQDVDDCRQVLDLDRSI
ncbi:MAG: bifunctional riboflavin kinase/FAD synthetase [Chloroflexi bacterium]|nr:bifunctional riboflavin kinase/FAD synthetase [Chloroflexota bacterium]MCI0788953.1 bifunctional riboflavin kinase/FAD synthetase [Chloroflexota bacterium]MCI0800940.1 bifunctional riboflavin kinase/FAD synthetase [Chloroflexota bacterium]MCI0830263.1 bifunctional riboflavin kinase/FAD synthetase [Chloroflexota bacterium]MCI0904051.1 bifunctional riboflavin kinase/FAD synthetase [Chloroflexota bacterium]